MNSRIKKISILLLLFTSIVSVFYYLKNTNNESLEETIRTKHFGKLQHEISYNAKNISDYEANEFAKKLFEIGFFDLKLQKSFFLDEVNNTFILYFFNDEMIAKDKEFQKMHEYLHEDLKKEFPNKKIIINLAVDNVHHVIKKIE